ncbi:MAG TPA: tRNA (adenosine(37)-N6)-threonylcarbamoyltransferase complex dimerization subunit type 1 TsaB [Dehalococcoidia bacterium]
MELSIDTAGDVASVALSQEGRLLAELTWNARRNHSAELLPAIDTLLRQQGADRTALTAVFVNRGPGGYAGLRVGMSTAMALAYGLGLPVVGVGRLEADAYQHAAFPGPVCAVHRAGRGELAWAAYQWDGEAERELVPPRLGTPEAVAREAPPGALFCGEVTPELAAALRAARGPETRLITGAGAVRRAGFLAELAWRRLAAGGGLEPGALEPIYLREPAAAPPEARAAES